MNVLTLFLSVLGIVWVFNILLEFCENWQVALGGAFLLVLLPQLFVTIIRHRKDYLEFTKYLKNYPPSDGRKYFRSRWSWYYDHFFVAVAYARLQLEGLCDSVSDWAQFASWTQQRIEVDPNHRGWKELVPIPGHHVANFASDYSREPRAQRVRRKVKTQLQRLFELLFLPPWHIIYQCFWSIGHGRLPPKDFWRGIAREYKEKWNAFLG